MRTPTPARHGLWVSLLTPFRRGAVDPDIVKEHAQWIVGQGIRGVSPTGPVGEFPYLTAPEKLAIYEALIPVTTARAALWPTVWESHEDAIRDTVRWLAPHDVTGVIVPPPMHYGFSEEEVVWYYRRLADGCPLPIMALHLPEYTRNSLTPEVLRALVVEGLVTGIVDGSGSESRLDALLEEFAGPMEIFNCNDGSIARSRTQGATGCVSAIANVFPELVREAWERSDIQAQALLDRVQEAGERYGLLSSLKYLLLRRAFNFGTRAPFGRLTPPQQQALDSLFQVVESEGFADAVRMG